MDQPRLMIGVPTHDRPEMLARALKSALAQSIPVEVLVGDDGNDYRRTQDIVMEQVVPPGFNLRVRHTGAKCLWANWDAVARACKTEFFLWLQDDDVIRPCVAERVVQAFDRFPEANLWLARNQLSLDGRLGWWNHGNGPHVLLDFADGVMDRWEGEIFAPTSYFTSWSLSPAVAFRAGDRFTRALDGMPLDCELFAERLILVNMMGGGGWFIADPIIAGLWVQHRHHASHARHPDQPRQAKILYRLLDRAMDGLSANWEEVVYQWACQTPPTSVLGWLDQFEHAMREGGGTEYAGRIRGAMWRSLEGRVQMVPRYTWWRRLYERLRGRAAL